MLEYAARSFRLHGFRDIVFLGDSGDYQPDNQAVAAKLNKEWANSPVRVHAIGRYYAVPTAWFTQWLTTMAIRATRSVRMPGSRTLR